MCGAGGPDGRRFLHFCGSGAFRDTAHGAIDSHPAAVGETTSIATAPLRHIGERAHLQRACAPRMAEALGRQVVGYRAVTAHRDAGTGGSLDADEGLVGVALAVAVAVREQEPSRFTAPIRSRRRHHARGTS